MRIKRAILLALLLILEITLERVWAEEILTLKSAIEKSLKNNHYLKSKNYEVISKEKELLISKDAFYPKIFLEEKFTNGNYNSYAVFTRLNQETLTMGNFFNPGTVTNFQTSVNLEMPLYVRELFINRDIKKSFFLSVKNELENFREEIAFQTFKAYLSVVKAKANCEMAKKSLEEAKEVYRTTKARVENGISVISDELRAYVFLKERESALIKAENDLKIAKEMLALIISEDKDFDIEERFTMDDILPELTFSINEALKNRKDLQSNKYNLEGLKKLVEIEKSKYYPKIFLGISYLNDGRNFPMKGDGSGYIAGINLRWDIFDKTRNDSKEKVIADMYKLKEMIKQMEKEIKFKVKESYLRVDEAKKRTEVAEGALKSAEETFRLIKLRYHNNLSTIVELIDAENSLNIARNSLIISQSDYYEAVGRSLFESGLFIKSLIKD